MKRTTTVLAVLAAGSLLVAGCSSTSPSTPTAATTSAASSDAESSATEFTSEATSEASAPESETSEETTTDGGSGGSTVLDAQSAAWFSTFCTGLGPVAELIDSGFTPTDPTTAQAEAVAGLTAMSESFSATAEALTELPPPTYDGGADLADAMIGVLENGSSTLAEAAATAAEITPGDAAAASAAAEQLTADLAAIGEPFEELGEIPPEIDQAVQELPACAAFN